MIGFALVVAAGAGSSGAASFGVPLILSPLSLHHGQDHPEHVEKDLVPAKLVGATWRLVERAGLVELVDILRDRWGVHHIYPRNENELPFVQGYTAARGRLFQFALADIRRRRSAFVRRRTIDRRNRHVVEPEIHAQLTAVMDDVMQDEAAERRNARQRKHLLSAALQRPH